MTRQNITGLAVAALIGVGAPAAAQASPSDEQYGNPAAKTIPAVTTIHAAPAHQGGTLPFTGLELGLFLGGGAAAVGAGVVVRRAARPRA